MVVLIRAQGSNRNSLSVITGLRLTTTDPIPHIGRSLLSHIIGRKEKGFRERRFHFSLEPFAC